jgi:hypothetical protein
MILDLFLYFPPYSHKNGYRFVPTRAEKRRIHS